MHEEMALVVKMVNERKITMEEALELLEALKQSNGDSSGTTGLTVFSPILEPEAAKPEPAVPAVPPVPPAPIVPPIPPMPPAPVVPAVPPAPTVAVSAPELSAPGASQAQWIVERRQFPTEQVEIKSHSGDIAYRTWERDYTQIIITASAKGPMSSEELQRRLHEAIVERIDDEQYFLQLQSELLDKHGISAAIEIFAPHKQTYEQFNMSLTNGNISAVGLEGEQLELSGVNGSLSIQELRCEDVKATTVNGSIDFHCLFTESSKLETTNGAVHVTGKFEDLQCKTLNGSVHLAEVSAEDVQLEAFNGDIRGECDFEDLFCKTNNGGIELFIRNEDEGRIRASSQMGSIQLYYPAGIHDLHGKLYSGHGHVECNIDGAEIIENSKDFMSSKLVFQVGEDREHELDASTGHGSVVISVK